MERDLFESILSLSLQLKIDVKNLHAEVLFEISISFFLFSYNSGLVQTTPERFRLKIKKHELLTNTLQVWILYGYAVDTYLCHVFPVTSY